MNHPIPSPIRDNEEKIETAAAVTTSPDTAANESYDRFSSRAPSADRDDNYDIYKQYRHAEFSAEEVKRVVRKIDLQLLPILVTIYTLQYLDKNAINFASVYGLQQGTHLSGQDYSWLGVFPVCFLFCVAANSDSDINTGSIFYFGYLIAQYPAGYFLQRLSIGKVIGITTLGRCPGMINLREPLSLPITYHYGLTSLLCVSE
jgi:hypothetical protein